MKTDSQEFVQTLKGPGFPRENLPQIIRTALTNVLGEVPALVILSYTGDASDGDLDGFLRRMQELLGTNAPVMLGNIVAWATKQGRGA